MDFNPDHEGIGRYLRECPELNAELMRRAHVGLAIAQGMAPRRTGRLARSGHVEYDGPHGGFHHDRMEYSVVFDVDYAAAATFPNHRGYLEAAKHAMEA